MAKTDWVDGNTVHGSDLNTLGAEVAAATAANAVNAAAVAGKQPLDADLTTIAGISPANDDVLQRKSGAWTNRTLAQLKTDLTLNNVNNTSDAGKPVSTAQQTALDLKANLASPTFTGTVSGVTKSHVGLGNVDNTADVDKPVSTATQTALTFMGYNVKDHGAVGDGSTNDRAALAAADTAAVAAGLPLLLPKGTYKVSSNLTIASPVKCLPGAVIKPDSAVTVTLAGGVEGPFQQIFDHSASGVVVPSNRDFYPEWWGPIKTSDDSVTWLRCLAANTAGYDGQTGRRIIAPAGINVVDELVFKYCELVASRGWTAFKPPAASTGKVMITLDDYSTVSGGRYISSGTGQSLLFSKGGRAVLDGSVYIDVKHDSCIGWIAGYTDGVTILSTTPVANIVHVYSGDLGTTLPASSIGVDVRSPDCKVNELWIGSVAQGLKGTNAGAFQCPSVHIWDCDFGITGDAWDKSQIAGYVESNRFWGVDVDKVDHARWDLYLWNNGTSYNSPTVTDTGGARFQQTSSTARNCRLNLFLDDNRGKSLHLNGPDFYHVNAILASSVVKGGSALPAYVVTGVEIASTCQGTDLNLYGADATTPLTNSSTTTKYNTPMANAIWDINGAPILGFSPTASAVNYWLINNSTGHPILTVTGTSTNINAYVRPRGTGKVGFQDGTDTTKILTHDVSNITTGTVRTAVWPDADINVAGTTNPQTLTATRLNLRVTSTATGSSLTPSIAASGGKDMYAYTALAGTLTIGLPGGVPLDGNIIRYRFKDDGTSRTLSWNGAFRAIGVTIPTATTIGKTLYVTTMYNAADTKWDVISVQQEA
jgi:hypothetical protein